MPPRRRVRTPAEQDRPCSVQSAVETLPAFRSQLHWQPGRGTSGRRYRRSLRCRPWSGFAGRPAGPSSGRAVWPSGPVAPVGPFAGRAGFSRRAVTGCSVLRSALGAGRARCTGRPGSLPSHRWLPWPRAPVARSGLRPRCRRLLGRSGRPAGPVAPVGPAAPVGPVAPVAGRPPRRSHRSRRRRRSLRSRPWLRSGRGSRCALRAGGAVAPARLSAPGPIGPCGPGGPWAPCPSVPSDPWGPSAPSCPSSALLRRLRRAMARSGLGKAWAATSISTLTAAISPIRANGNPRLWIVKFMPSSSAVGYSWMHTVLNIEYSRTSPEIPRPSDLDV